MSALALELVERGHRCTFFLVADFEEIIRLSGLGFHPIGQEEYPSGSWPPILERLGQEAGLSNLSFTVETYRREVEIICRDVPAAVKRLGIEALLVDQSEPAGGAVAEFVGLPFITVCVAVLLDQEDEVPPPVFDWPFREGWLSRLRNRVGYQILNRLSYPIWRTLTERRRAWGLVPLGGYDDTCSKLAQISQQPPGFEFPRRKANTVLHFCGPLRKLGPLSGVGFPYERLTGKPIVYASLGTLQGQKVDLFESMATACADLPVQLVLAHAGNLDETVAERLPGNPIAVPWAPQLDLLSRSAVCITHCGMNTVLDALSFGVPMLGLPQVHDQPGIARRVEWTGTGIVLRPGRQTPARMRHGILGLLKNPSYRESAARMVESIRISGGAVRAADICENAINYSRS